jgi:hypothetical protein
METRLYRLTLTEEALGSASANPDIHREYIASKAPDAESREEEVARLGVDAVDAKGRTVFPRTADGHPMLWDYQIKGFFKDSCGALWRVKGTKSKALKAYKKVIDGNIFVDEREIPFMLDGIYVDVHKRGGVGVCERPLRAETMQGPRVALASSETVPAGCTLTFHVTCLGDDANFSLVEEWLDFGAMRGIGQWRNSGKGRFFWERIDERTGEVVDGNRPQPEEEAE